MNIVSAVILCTIVGAIGAVVLVLAAKFMAVEEDPRIEEVSACLAGANCGGCGYAGCADYAKAVVMDGVPCDKCAPGGPKAAAAIAKIMGGEMCIRDSPGGAAICGAMLWYPDETIQHAGIVTGLGGYAGHSHKYKKKGGSGYLFRTSTVQDFSGVTGACLLVKTAVYDEMHGLDEQFAVAFNDVDFCLRVRDAGYRIAWTPYAELVHYESKSRGGDEKDPVKAARFAAEQQRLYTIHGKENILDDPYYNPNLTRDREDFSESDDLRRLKEGRVTVRFRGGTLQ